MENQQKKPYEVPNLTEYGSLSGITQNHKPQHDPPGNAWGLYKDKDKDKYDLLPGFS